MGNKACNIWLNNRIRLITYYPLLITAKMTDAIPQLRAWTQDSGPRIQDLPSFHTSHFRPHRPRYRLALLEVRHETRIAPVALEHASSGSAGHDAEGFEFAF